MTTDYVNDIEYEDGILNLIHMEEGRITKSGSVFAYEYFLRDHLGNVRSGFTSAAPTVASVRSDYYPFGLQYQSNILVGSPKNRYLYNGKELQDGSKLYDYGARLYDPVIGRWGKVDPLGENHFDKSPYNYVLNNPMGYVDPFGLDTVDYNSLRTVMQGDDIRLKDGSIALNSLPDVNVFGGENNQNSAFVSGLIAINEFNPLAHFVNVVSYGFTGRDRFGNSMSAMDAYAGVLSVIPVGGAALSGVSKVAAKTGTTALTKFYPANNGFLGAAERTFLMPGQQISRFGSNSGKFFSPAGTPLPMRALPPGANTSIHNTFKVLKPFEVQSGKIAPAFGQPGLGTQYLSPVSVDVLLKRGIIGY